jgi:hypothetical protein
MFGRVLPSSVLHPYHALVKPGLRFVQTAITSIDPATKRVETKSGVFEGDILVVALGADLDPAATPGLVEAGHEFYTVSGAFAFREVLSRFDGGNVIVGVTSTPFKCPPAPSETARLMHDFLTERGVRHDSRISLVMPFGIPIPPSPAASEALLVAFAARDIDWCSERIVRSLDPNRKVVVLNDGSEMAFDLFLGVPVHKAPAVVVESGMTKDGWIPVNPLTLETAFADVYAVGDVTSVGTPKAGVFAEGQASVGRHLLEWGSSDWRPGRTLWRDRRRQGRVRDEQHPTLVRSHLDEWSARTCLTCMNDSALRVRSRDSGTEIALPMRRRRLSGATNSWRRPTSTTLASRRDVATCTRTRLKSWGLSFASSWQS